jgi:D-beta-D-heptose 7-phosphate kinase / D-beta-D-heptose 1-phosphate adenosyltransferase
MILKDLPAIMFPCGFGAPLAVLKAPRHIRGRARTTGPTELDMTLNMSTSIARYLSDFTRKRVLVVGDAILDEYLLGECSRISPEAPVPVLKVHNSRYVLGGAANTAANIVSLGGAATLIALVGNDEGGRTLRQCAADAGVELCGIDHRLATLRKTRVVGQHQQIVRLDYEDIPEASEETIAAVLAMFQAQVPHADIVVISDYAKGLLSVALAAEIIRAAHEADCPVIVDPRPQNRHCYAGCDYLTPNWKESRALLGLPDADPTPDNASETARRIAADTGANVVLTLGPHGMLFCGRREREQFAVPTLAREVFDVSGAGDTVVAAFALSIAAGADHAVAVDIANKAASVVVGKFGTATVTREEILQDSDTLRLVPRQALAPLATTLRARGKRIVTVNGSFDILHNGHLHILNEARGQGDVLIVGLNSDKSVHRSKGPERPIVTERHRAEMLLALRPVDYVHIFDESDPIAFLKEVRPDVHVNGAEYGEHCVESETVKRAGGRLHLVGRVPDLSTSNLIEALQAPQPRSAAPSIRVIA